MSPSNIIAIIATVASVISAAAAWKSAWTAAEAFELQRTKAARDLISIISPMPTDVATGTIIRLCEAGRDETIDRVSMVILKHPCP
jgi:hypothetical protein